MINNRLKWIEKIPSLWKVICTGNIQPYEQNHKKATYCAQRRDIDGEIDWTLNASALDAFIRAQDHPYPRAFTRLNNKNVKIVKHKIDTRKIFGSAGQIFQINEDHVTICCGENTAINIYKVEVDGKIEDAKRVINSIKIRLKC